MTVQQSNQVTHLTEYELRHLAEHLEASGRTEELHRLLALETSEQHNLWYEEKNAFGDAAGFVADIVRAWQLADKTYYTHNDELSGRIIGLQVRYALIIASINSFAFNVPAELVPSLVVNGIWPPEQALAYVHQIPNLNQQSAALIELASHLPQSLVIEEITRVHGIADEKLRVKTLSGLISCLPENQYSSALEELLSILKKSSDGALQMDVLVRLAPHLPKSYLEQALAIARGIDTSNDRMRALQSIVPYLPERERFQVWKEALAAAVAIDAQYSRLVAIAELAPHLPYPLLKNSLSMAKIQDRDWRKYLFAEIAPFLSPPRLQEALTGAREIRSNSWRAKALIALAPHLPGRERLSVLEDALVAVKKISNEDLRAVTLGELAPHLTDKLFPNAFAIAKSVKYHEDRVRALKALAPYLPDIDRIQTFRKALAIARSIPKNHKRVRAVSRLAPYLPEALLREALATTCQIADEEDQMYLMVKLAPYLPESLLMQVLTKAESMTNRSRTYLLLDLLPYCSETEKLRVSEELINTTMNKEDSWDLAGLTTYLSEPLLRQALAKARRLRDKDERALAQTSLFPRLANLGYAKEALAGTKRIKDEYDRAEALKELGPYLSGSQLIKALNIARTIKNNTWKINALAGIMIHLTSDEREHVLWEALTAMQKIKDEGEWIRALYPLAPHLSEPMLRKTLPEALRIKKESSRLASLRRLLPRLAELGFSGEALSITWKIADEMSRAEMLAILVPYLPETERSQYIQDALLLVKAESKYVREMALESLAKHLPESLIPEILDAVQITSDAPHQANVIKIIAPHLPVALLGEALMVARNIERYDCRRDALRGLASCFLERSLQEDKRYSLWCATLHFLSERTRNNLLSDIRALIPVIVALGGENAAVATYHTIQDVASWWP